MRTSALARHVVLYGLIGGVFIVALRLIEYRWLVVDHSIEIYGALVAAVFATVGIWIGLRVVSRVIFGALGKKSSAT